MTTREKLNISGHSAAVSVLLALAISLLVLSANPVGAQDQIRILGFGGSDELVPPPSPRCDDLVFITEVSFDAAGNPIDIPRFGSSPELTQVFDVPGFEPVGPGVIILDEVIVYDGHIGRAVYDPQPNEQVYFEFLLDGVSQGRTPLTPDVPDDQRTNWLDLDMGSYEVPNGADTLRIHHWGPGPDVNSLVVSALCGRHTPTQEIAETTTTTAPDSTVAPTTEAPSTTAVATTEAPATTAAPTTQAPATTTAPTTTIETEVQGQVEEQGPELAVTGFDPKLLVAVGLLSIAFGMILSRRRHPALDAELR